MAGLLPGGWLKATCGLTACTPRSFRAKRSVTSVGELYPLCGAAARFLIRCERTFSLDDVTAVSAGGARVGCDRVRRVKARLYREPAPHVTGATRRLISDRQSPHRRPAASTPWDFSQDVRNLEVWLGFGELAQNLSNF